MQGLRPRSIRKLARGRTGSSSVLKVTIPKRDLAACVAMALVLVACAGGNASSANTPRSSRGAETDVREAYTQYRAAALAKRGQIAVRYLSSATLNYYDECRRDALTMPDRTLVGTVGPTQMLTILGVRAEFDAQTLRSITASALVARFVDMGLIGEEGLRKLKLGEVLVDGDIASAVALNGATPAGFSYLFAKEQGRWKLDLTSLNDAADPHLINAAHDAGLPMPAYIDSVLEARYGAARVKQLHHPLGP